MGLKIGKRTPAISSRLIRFLYLAPVYPAAKSQVFQGPAAKATKWAEVLPLALAGTKCGGYKPAVWSRSVAQSGSAPRSGRGGRRFKSCHSDQKKQ